VIVNYPSVSCVADSLMMQNEKAQETKSAVFLIGSIPKSTPTTKLSGNMNPLCGVIDQSLHRGEDNVLQFDSHHMRLRQSWDTYLIQQHQRLVNQRGDDRVVLTTYPIGYTLPNRVPNETRGTLLVPWKFDGCGLLRQRGRLMHPRTDPVPSPLIAVGVVFGPAATPRRSLRPQFASTLLWRGVESSGPILYLWLRRLCSSRNSLLPLEESGAPTDSITDVGA